MSIDDLASEKLIKLAARRRQLLSQHPWDVAAIRKLADDYDAAGFIANAELLRSRIRHYEYERGDIASSIKY
jgi:hypothetical protein